MRNILFVIVSVFLSLLFTATAYSQEKPADNKQKVEEKSSSGIVNTICPVSTEDVDGEITYNYKGKTYALCCKSCLKKFKNDPEKYISRLSEDGKSIVKKKEVN